MSVCFSLSQNVEAASLDLQHPVPFFLPVRTKKRYFIPPAVGLKKKRGMDPEAKARAAGIVFRQEYLERPINIACTGKMYLLAWYYCRCFTFLAPNVSFEHCILLTLCSDNTEHWNHNIFQNVTRVFVWNCWWSNRNAHGYWSVVSCCLHQRESLTHTSLQRVTLVFPLCQKKAWNSERSRYDRVPLHSWRKTVSFSWIFFLSCISRITQNCCAELHKKKKKSCTDLKWLLLRCFRIRKIKEYDSEFSSKTFAEQAQEIFIEAHNALAG